jgi:hypothetical protein
VSQVRSRIEKIGCKATVHELESHELGLLGRQSVRELSDGLAISVVDERATLDALVQVRPLLRPEKRGERWTHTSRSRATTIYPSLQGERRDNCSYLLNSSSPPCFTSTSAKRSCRLNETRTTKRRERSKPWKKVKTENSLSKVQRED